MFDSTKYSPQPTNPTENGEVLQIPTNWYGDFAWVFCQYFLHELCHEMFWKFNQPDVTHFYHPDFAKKRRTDWYLHLLKNFVPLLKKDIVPTVTLARKADDTVQTLGELSVGNFVCKSLERPWKNNAKNISSIPRGIYDCKWTFSPRLMRYTYEVLKVPNRSGIRFHKGNYFFDVDGCILLGSAFQDINFDGKKDVINSTITLASFEKLMNKKPFKLNII